MHSISDGIVYLPFQGDVSAADITRGRASFLGDPAFEPGMNFLVDLREATIVALSTPQLEVLADEGREMATGWGPHRTGVVVARDVDFGVIRVFEILGKRPGLELEVFRDYDECLRWLKGGSP